MFFGENLRWLLTERRVAPKKIAEAINVKVNTISNYIHGVSTPSYELLAKIVKFLDVSVDDILYKDLSVFGLSDENASITAPIVAPNEISEEHNVPKTATVARTVSGNAFYVPSKATPDYLKRCGDGGYIATLPAYRIPGFENGEFRIFEVNSNAMAPTLKSRERIIGKWCELSEIKDAGIYIIISRTEGIIIKRVLNRIKKNGVLILQSDNNGHEHPEIVIGAGDVIESWAGVGKISKELAWPNDFNSRLIDAEGRLTMIENLLKRK